MAKLLILTSRTGGGHVSLAEALRDRLAARHDVEIVDPQPAGVRTHYRLVSRYALWLWAAEYGSSNTPARARLAHQTFSRLLRGRINALLERARPDAIISTYPFLTVEVQAVLRRRRQTTPFAMLFSDPDHIHAAWLTERNATATLAPTRETFEQALVAGFDPARLHLTGWPVRTQFERGADYDRTATLRDLGLDPARFTVFLQGGGEGAARFIRTVGSLAGAGDAQILLAAGTNRALLDAFAGNPAVRAIPFTKAIAPLMAAADVVMGKAGPNMLFEAVTLGKPFIATAYIPGQESANLAFIERHHLGWVALAPAAQRELISLLSADRGQLALMAQSVHTYRAWNMAANAALQPVVEELLCSPTGPKVTARPSS